MSGITRLPATPIIVNDPYFSIWSAADRPTDRDTTHWAGADKPIRIDIKVDGRTKRLLGLGDNGAMKLVKSAVSATATEFTYEDMGVRAALRFVSPLLMDDPDVLSAAVSYGEVSAESIDGKEHDVSIRVNVSSSLCYNGEATPPLMCDGYNSGDLNIAYVGQRDQKFLCHSGDHITIDWGYLYLASRDDVKWDEGGLQLQAGSSTRFIIAYDDVASINYFGRITPAWYARNGKTFMEMLMEMDGRRDELMEKCARLDGEIDAASRSVGGGDYALITAAAYRQCLGAHKLIADENGDMVFLSKENDSNGCIGTVDVSYPSIPLMLMYNPELVRALCRHILRFAEMPVWKYDFAPHDVGRYPMATGQVYAAITPARVPNGATFPPYYLYPASAECYDFRYQMPVEECGNMLLMLAAAAKADGNADMAIAHMETLEKWVRYLMEFGEDPGEQLCTDDFAGHLARNVNLSAKAVCGVAAYAMLKRIAGDEKTADEYMEKARQMADSWLSRCDAGDHTSLTFDGIGWSMKYNMIWDRLFDLGLMDDKFYARENEWYLKVMNEYGLPLDSRSDYTKSDWIMWVAAMVSPADVSAYCAPMAKYLKESRSRVAFSDWYDTRDGIYQHFIARSVQGGVFMPLLMKKWRNDL